MQVLYAKHYQSIMLAWYLLSYKYPLTRKIFSSYQKWDKWKLTNSLHLFISKYSMQSIMLNASTLCKALCLLDICTAKNICHLTRNEINGNYQIDRMIPLMIFIVMRAVHLLFLDPERYRHLGPICMDNISAVGPEFLFDLRNFFGIITLLKQCHLTTNSVIEREDANGYSDPLLKERILTDTQIRPKKLLHIYDKITVNLWQLETYHWYHHILILYFNNCISASIAEYNYMLFWCTTVNSIIILLYRTNFVYVFQAN